MKLIKPLFSLRNKNKKNWFAPVVSILLLLLTVYFVFLLFIIRKANTLTEISSNNFFQKHPDVIIVFTGDSGRLDYAFKRLDKIPTTKMFISGVYIKNSLKTLILSRKQSIPPEEFLTQSGYQIELDYFARNTVENVIAAVRYLRKDDQIKDVLVVSSDYHLLRIKMLFDTISDSKNYHLNFEGVKTNYGENKNIIKLVKESFKVLRTIPFMMIWDLESYTKN